MAGGIVSIPSSSGLGLEPLGVEKISDWPAVAVSIPSSSGLGLERRMEVVPYKIVKVSIPSSSGLGLER